MSAKHVATTPASTAAKSRQAISLDVIRYAGHGERAVDMLWVCRLHSENHSEKLNESAQSVTLEMCITHYKGKRYFYGLYGTHAYHLDGRPNSAKCAHES